MQVEGETVLKFALCYGFRNLQNIVRKIKIGKCDYNFIEVMACPSGNECVIVGLYVYSFKFRLPQIFFFQAAKVNIVRIVKE